MASPTIVPLAFLYADGRRQIEGATRFQKLVFLAQKEGGLPEVFEYESDKYGPFSKELHATLDELERRGLISKDIKTTESGHEKYTYSLTDTGYRVIRNVKDRVDLDLYLEPAQELKSERNDQPMERLLRYVYSKYPEYTDRSEIKSELEM